MKKRWYVKLDFEFYTGDVTAAAAEKFVVEQMRYALGAESVFLDEVDLLDEED